MNEAKAPEPAEDPEIDPQEMIEASDERTSPDVPPEVPAGLEAMVEWDTPTTSSGSAAPKVGVDDEATVGEQLVMEGIDEAEREQRVAAAEGPEEQA